MNRLSVITDRGGQWKYSLLVFMVSNNKGNIISLARDSDTELHVEFTKEMLPVNGRYIMQFEYTNGNIVGHTDKFDAYVKDVINLEDTWAGVPSEFEQLRQEVMQNATIAQNAANEAEQISQEIKVEVDRAVEAANKAQQNSQQVEQAVKLAQEAQRLAQQASEVAQSAKDEAVLASNEAEQSATQANQSAAQASVSEDGAKKAQLASEKARDESQTILEQIQGIKTEVDGIVAQINEARDKALQDIEANKNFAVESVNNAGQEQVKAVNDSGAIQTANAKEQADRAKTEADRAESVVANKLDKPTTTPAVNQILKVKSVNPDGSFVVEWADDGGGTVQDVQINGDTIVQDGVANIPIASRSYHGVIRPWRNISLSGSYPGSIYIPEATKQNMTEREYYAVVQTHQWDEMLKYAMCDGKGPAWTAVEQAAARDRMGVKGYQLFADVVVDEAVSSVSFTLPEESTSAMYIIEVPSEVAHTSTTSQTMYLQSTARESNNAYVYLGPIVHDKRSVVCAKIEKIDDELWVLNYSGVYSGDESTTQFGNRTGRVPPFVVKDRIVKVHKTDKMPKGVLIKIYVR